MEDVELRPVDRDNLNKVVKLKVEDGDNKFVAPNMYSIAEAYVEPDTKPTAIYFKGVPVGFILYGQFAEDNGDYWVGRLMVDKDFRGIGIGKRGMELALEDMRADGADSVYVSLVPDNDYARELYLKLGFIDTKTQMEGEDVFKFEF